LGLHKIRGSWRGLFAMKREELGAHLRQLRQNFISQYEKLDGEFTVREYAEENKITDNIARKELERLFKRGILERRMITSPCKTYFYKEKQND